MEIVNVKKLRELIPDLDKNVGSRFCFLHNHIDKNTYDSLKEGNVETIYIANTNIDSDTIWIKIVLKGYEEIEVKTASYTGLVINDQAENKNIITITKNHLRDLIIDCKTGKAYVFELFNQDKNLDEEDNEIIIPMIETSVINSLILSRADNNTIGIIYDFNSINTPEDLDVMINNVYNILEYFRSIIGLNTEDVHMALPGEDLDFSVSPEADKHLIKTIYRHHMERIKKSMSLAKTKLSKSNTEDNLELVDGKQLEAMTDIAHILVDTNSNLSLEEKIDIVDKITTNITKDNLATLSMITVLSKTVNSLLETIQEMKDTIKYQKEQIELLKNK